jgi:hypothetical protein
VLARRTSEATSCRENCWRVIARRPLAIRPIHHQLDHRIEAHIFVAFLAYCLQVTLKQRLRVLAPGLTPKGGAAERHGRLVDVRLPTTDGRHIVLPRCTQPDREVSACSTAPRLLITEPPPTVTATTKASCVWVGYSLVVKSAHMRLRPEMCRSHQLRVMLCGSVRAMSGILDPLSDGYFQCFSSA